MIIFHCVGVLSFVQNKLGDWMIINLLQKWRLGYLSCWSPPIFTSLTPFMLEFALHVCIFHVRFTSEKKNSFKLYGFFVFKLYSLSNIYNQWIWQGLDIMFQILSELWYWPRFFSVLKDWKKIFKIWARPWPFIWNTMI